MNRNEYLSLYRMISGDEAEKNDSTGRNQRLQRVRIVRRLQTKNNGYKTYDII